MKHSGPKRGVAVSSRTTGQRLRRKGQVPAHSVEPGSAEVKNLIVIGASAGGINALAQIFETVPADIPAAIVIVLHQGTESTFRMAAALGRLTDLPIVTVDTDVPLRPGTIFIPHPGMTLSFKRNSIQESSAAPEPGASTTINRMFASAAEAYGDRVIGVVLSGLLRDGTDGLRTVHDRGGLTIVQDPTGAEYPDMPSSAREGLPVTFCLAAGDIGPALDLLSRRSARLETGLAVAVRMLKKRVELLVRLIAQCAANGDSQTFLEEELAALNRDVGSINRLLQSVPPP